MRKTFIPFGLGMLIAVGAVMPNQLFAQKAKKSKTETTVSTDSVTVNSKEEKKP